MNNSAIIARITNIRKIEGADNIVQGTVCGNNVVVSKDVEENSIGIYFETGLQLSDEFCKANNLYREKSKNEDIEKSGFFELERRVRTLKLRGEKSDGFFCPVSYLDFSISSGSGTYKGKDVAEGFEFTSLGSTPICQKYIPKHNACRSGTGTGPQEKKPKIGSIMFKEHFDTAHFGKNVDKIPLGSRVIITEKVHGTSQRVGHVWTKDSGSVSLYTRILLFLNSFRVKDFFWKPSTWQYLNGTRRVVLQPNQKPGFHEVGLRENAAKPFIGNLRKGETIYFEVVGYEPSGKLIMPSGDNRKLKDKEFLARYGETTNFTYGCKEGESKVFVYRITMTNEDGQSIDYPWEDVKSRCNELGVAHVPELICDIVNDYDDLNNLVEMLTIGKSKLDNHISEGVCVRVESSMLDLKVYKHKSFEFKVLEGIIKDTGVVDMEEVQQLESVM